ncbi:MAG: isoprenylcysteine carboxylmethyltransferase family protein [Alphaproteobacteria bacterium]|nr:isoprenylcysteine carboxylmethyltransferase family protein [Alphaproteobacteria bacterium]
MAVRLVVQTLAFCAFMGVLLFGGAGTLNWPQAWAFLALFGVLGLGVGFWLLARDPGLLAERLGSPVARDQMAWDRALMALVFLLFFAWLVFMGLDAVRYGWTSTPRWAQWLGAGLIVLSNLGGAWTFHANSFAAPTVKTQSARGHAVATGGPYALVRHPMYTSALLMMLGVPLLLGSLWGLVAFPVLLAVVWLRARGEEKMLLTELPAYAEYAARVRARFFPGLF